MKRRNYKFIAEASFIDTHTPCRMGGTFFAPTKAAAYSKARRAVLKDFPGAKELHIKVDKFRLR